MASAINAAPSDNDGNGMNDNFGSLQGPQLADNGMSGNGTMNNAPSAMSGASNMSGNMSGTPGNNMSGTPGSNMSGTQSNNMSGSASPSDEGGADTATGDDY